MIRKTIFLAKRSRNESVHLYSYKQLVISNKITYNFKKGNGLRCKPTHTSPFPTWQRPPSHHETAEALNRGFSFSSKFETIKPTENKARRNAKVKLKSTRRRLGAHPPPTPMDAPRGGHARRPGSSGEAANQRRAAAAQAMARMEEMMLAHAGAAGEFSIILDAPLPSLQQYRRHPTPPSGPPSASSANSSPFRRGGGGGRDEGVPARLRRDGSGHDALGDPVTAARASRHGAADGTGAGAARPRAGGARREREQEKPVEAPVRLTDPRSVRRPVSRGETPPPTAAEVRRVADQEEEEETPLKLLARGGRSSSAARPAEASQASETVPTAARPSSRRSRRDVGAKQGLSEVTSNVDSDVESVGRRSSRGSEDGGDERVSLPMPLAAVVARDRSRSNSPAISNVKIVSLPFVISSN
jgi:hypothetical protein